MEPKAEGARCDECSLKQEKYVPTDGSVQSTLVFVGEAPGQQEASKGRPFVGPSGKLLDAVLSNYGIDRDNVRLTNTVLCRPPKNRTPSKLEIECCSERLRLDLEAATTIVPLGGTATNAVMGTKAPISRVRPGPPKSSHLYPSARVIPTFHPAACLRSGDSFPSFVTDIGKIVNDTPRWSEPRFRIFDTEESAIAAIREIELRYSELVIDIETGAEKDSSFEHANLQKLLCIGLGYKSGTAIVIGEIALQSARVRSALGRILTSKKIIGHNVKFDLAGVKHIATGNAYFDTMLASYVLDERGGTHGLKYLATEILGTPDYESEIKQYLQRGHIDYADIPRDTLYKYNAYDIACTWGLYEYYRDQFDDENWRLHNMLIEASNELMSLEMGGIKLDEERLDNLQIYYELTLAELAGRLSVWVKNPNSPKQVQAALAAVGVNVDSTAVGTLEEVRGLAKDPIIISFVDLLLEYRKVYKLNSTYVKGLKKRAVNGRVYPTFLLHGTTTGRLSCRNPNLQNIPRGSSIRSVFVPDNGNVFIQADYSQAELRTVAALASDSYLQGVFNDGRDIHGEVAERFFGPGWTKEQRVKAKMVVFGLTYAMTPHGLAKRMHIPLDEAQRYQAEFFAVIPQVVEWREQVKQLLLADGEDLVTPFGRRRRYGLITRENQEDIVKEGTAFLPQSIASDIALNALMQVNRGLKDSAAIRVPVHDSIMVECPVDEADEVAAFMKKTMEDAALLFTDYVKYEVDVNISANGWGDL